MSTLAKSILTIGLVLPPSPQVSAIQSAVSENLALANRSGYRAESYAIDVADPSHLAALKAHLNQKTWDGVLVGWGIRGNPDHNELFENILNAIVECQKPVPKLVFSMKPDDLMKALSRNFEVQS